MALISATATSNSVSVNAGRARAHREEGIKGQINMVSESGRHDVGKLDEGRWLDEVKPGIQPDVVGSNQPARHQCAKGFLVVANDGVVDPGDQRVLQGQPQFVVVLLVSPRLDPEIGALQ